MSGSGPRILIVDDDASLRRLYMDFLTSEGFEVQEISDGEQVLLGSRGMDFDVVLLDIHMPGVDGLALAPAIQRLHPNVKIIVSSCHDLHMQKKMVGDAADYFNKSDGCFALLAKIKAVLSLKES